MELRSPGEKVFAVFNYLIMFVIAFVTLYPMWHIFVTSFSDPAYVMMFRGNLRFLPMGTPTIRGYQLVFDNPNIMSGYRNTIFVVVVGSALSMLINIMGAYTLSRKGLYWNGLVMKMIVFTIFFQGGLVPFYIQVMNMGLLNNIWSVILPVMVNAIWLIILRTSFAAVPDSLIESAKLDGCSEWRILWQLVVPVSKAAVMVILLFYIVHYWNQWFNPSIFLNDRTLWPIQLVMREILIQGDQQGMVQIGGVGQAAV